MGVERLAPGTLGQGETLDVGDVEAAEVSRRSASGSSTATVSQGSQARTPCPRRGGSESASVSRPG